MPIVNSFGSARDSLVEVSEVARRATVRVNELEVSKNAMRLFLAVNHYLVLYSKFEDRIAHSELVAVSGLTYRRDFDEAKAELLAGEVFYCESGKGGRGKAAVWGYAQSLRNPPEKPSGEITLNPPD